LQLINRGCKTALQMNKGRHECGWSIAYSLISALTHNLQLHSNVILLISKIFLQGCLNTGVIGNGKSLSCRLSFPWSPVIDKWPHWCKWRFFKKVHACSLTCLLDQLPVRFNDKLKPIWDPESTSLVSIFKVAPNSVS